MHQEEWEFKIEVDFKKYMRFKKSLKTIMPNLPSVLKGDTLTITYKVWVEYLGDCAKKLAAINRLLHARTAVRGVSLKELRHGKSVLLSLLKQISKVQAKLGRSKHA